jgi:hypothetical protein
MVLPAREAGIVRLRPHPPPDPMVWGGIMIRAKRGSNNFDEFPVAP